MHPIEPKRDSRVIKLTRLVNKLMNHILCMKNMVEFVFKGVGTIGIGEKCSIRMQSLENLGVYPPTPLTTQVMTTIRLSRRHYEASAMQFSFILRLHEVR